ncbi:FCP1 homology domain-containing protein [Haematococcus lacustris]|uniref:FCP1 homology domain-containing protein n=1 Tax=Haematococcus lacustris TaxID=44745 RepID=A0A699ZGQ8_HAELA|nr:FCP1 homology domain-containing protein [Haematococcus lacustris]
MLEAEAGCPLFERQLVLHRAHTQPAPQHHMLGCGLEWQPYDTLKPLARWFARPERVLLFDDDQYKAVAGEEQHMVVVPSWGMDEPKACTVLQRLVEVTLKAVSP